MLTRIWRVQCFGFAVAKCEFEYQCLLAIQISHRKVRCLLHNIRQTLLLGRRSIMRKFVSRGAIVGNVPASSLETLLDFDLNLNTGEALGSLVDIDDRILLFTNCLIY